MECEYPNIQIRNYDFKLCTLKCFILFDHFYNLGSDIQNIDKIETRIYGGMLLLLTLSITCTLYSKGLTKVSYLYIYSCIKGGSNE